MKKGNRKLMCGVGINDAPYSTFFGYGESGKQIRCPYYMRWKSLIQRCYNPNAWKDKNKFGYLKNAQYENCIVVDEWHRFTNFKSWMETQNWKGNHLDKDIIIPGNVVYGPDTCLFVPPHINCMLVNQKRGKFPQGVKYDKRANLYSIRVRINGKKTERGCWKTVEEAEKKFKEFRYNEIVFEANKLTDMRVKECLINYANIKYKVSVILNET